MEGDAQLPFFGLNLTLLVSGGKLIKDMQDSGFGHNHSLPLPSPAPVVSLVSTTIPQAQNSHNHIQLTLPYLYWVCSLWRFTFLVHFVLMSADLPKAADGMSLWFLLHCSCYIHVRACPWAYDPITHQLTSFHARDARAVFGACPGCPRWPQMPRSGGQVGSQEDEERGSQRSEEGHQKDSRLPDCLLSPAWDRFSHLALTAGAEFES